MKMTNVTFMEYFLTTCISSTFKDEDVGKRSRNPSESSTGGGGSGRGSGQQGRRSRTSSEGDQWWTKSKTTTTGNRKSVRFSIHVFIFSKMAKEPIISLNFENAQNSNCTGCPICSWTGLG